jgi:serine/threonine protein phosphatase PrpC
MTALTWLGKDHLDPAIAAVREALPGVVCALTPGEGPSRNPKQQKNEDSLGLVAIEGGVVAVVADAHWGAYAGEALVKAAVAALPAKLPSSAAALAEHLLALDAGFREARPAGDVSETTLLVAVVRGRKAIWASVADSHLYVVRGPSVERLNADRHTFAGGEPTLTQLADRVGRDAAVAEGEVTLGPGDVLVLASDGIAPEDSGLESVELARELGKAGPLATRVRAFVDRARRSKTGGGRDNLALVAIDAEALARGHASG